MAVTPTLPAWWCKSDNVSEYQTGNGYRLAVGRVPKATADEFLSRCAPPPPPTRRAVAFGGLVEELPDPTNPAYQHELAAYVLRLSEERFAFVAGAVRVLNFTGTTEVAELATLGLLTPQDQAGLLRLVVLSNPADLLAVLELICYQSTVTERGIQEAYARFNAQWAGQSALRWGIPHLPGSYSREYEDRRAARHSGLSFAEFCALPGPEQSAVVAFMRLEMRLEWLSSQR